MVTFKGGWVPIKYLIEVICPQNFLKNLYIRKYVNKENS